jgi:hypothetical protein
MPACHISPTDKRAFGKAVGDELLKRHGKQRFYSVEQVNNAVRRLDYPIDWSCWAFSLYTSPLEFRTYHDYLGEACDYGEMKAQMFSAMTDGASSSWFDIDMSWLEWPDIDLSCIFEFFDWN